MLRIDLGFFSQIFVVKRVHNCYHGEKIAWNYWIMKEIESLGLKLRNEPNVHWIIDSFLRWFSIAYFCIYLVETLYRIHLSHRELSTIFVENGDRLRRRKDSEWVESLPRLSFDHRKYSRFTNGDCEGQCASAILYIAFPRAEKCGRDIQLTQHYSFLQQLLAFQYFLSPLPPLPILPSISTNKLLQMIGTYCYIILRHHYIPSEEFLSILIDEECSQIGSEMHSMTDSTRQVLLTEEVHQLDCCN